MAATVDGNILNKDNNRKYLFRGLAPLSNRKNQPAISVPIVNAKPENNVLFRFIGQTQAFAFTFAIFDDGVDTADGTHGSTIKTVNEQIAYLMDYIYTEDYDVDWTFTQARHAPGGVDGIIEDLDINNKAGGVTVAIGSIVFKRGRIGALS